MYFKNLVIHKIITNTYIFFTPILEISGKSKLQLYDVDDYTTSLKLT